MKNSYLSGNEMSALSLIYCTRAPFQNGRPGWLQNGVRGLIAKKLAAPVHESEEDEYGLTPKGVALIEAIHLIPEPINTWVVELPVALKTPKD
jgi:hypothetical protein